MPTSIAESVDHQKRFQAAVDVIHNLPKNGSYRPSYEVMLSFYSLYKQAVCGPCGVSRPGFWDPVGRYKWDAWNRLGEMSSESAMAAYVEEMKKVAQEVIDTMPMNEKTASLFHHFEPLYVVIHDMPRPPGVLLGLREDVLHSDEAANIEQEEVIQEQPAPGEVVPDQKPSQTDEATSNNEPQAPVPSAEGLVLTSDSESEIFCDSVDSVEQLDITEVEIPKSNGLHNGHAYSEPSSAQAVETVSQTTQAGVGQGGERAGEGRGLPMRRSRDTGRDGIHQEWRERGVPQGSPRRAGREAPGSGGGAGRGGGDGSEGGAERPQDLQVQQQIVTALRRLREDMRRVMDRLEVVERLAAAHAQSPDWRPCMQCAAAASHLEEDRWWPFDLSGRTTLLLLLWPFVAQGLVFLLRRGQRKSRISI